MRGFEYIIIVGWVFGRRRKCAWRTTATCEAEARKTLWRNFDINKDKVVSWSEVSA